MYGPYTNERFLGSAIKGRRDKLVIATKFGFAVDQELRPIGLDGSPTNARRVCEASLKRLDVDVIDLFYQHRVDPEIPLEESIGGMSELVGEVKFDISASAKWMRIRCARRTLPILLLRCSRNIRLGSAAWKPPCCLWRRNWE